MKIESVKAYPISFPIPEKFGVSLGIGRAIKRDAVLVKVTTSDGIVGWGESHAGRAPGAIAQLANTTLTSLIEPRTFFVTAFTMSVRRMLDPGGL